MTGLFFVQKWRFFFKHLPTLQKTIFLQSRTCFSSYTCADWKKKLFLFQLQICGSSSACRKKTGYRRIAPVPPFWDICQWQNFPGNLNTWPNTSWKRFVLLPFLQPKINVQKSMLLYWCCSLRALKSFDHSLALSVKNMVKLPIKFANLDKRQKIEQSLRRWVIDFFYNRLILRITDCLTTVTFAPFIVNFLINWNNWGAGRWLGRVRPLGRLPYGLCNYNFSFTIQPFQFCI